MAQTGKGKRNNTAGASRRSSGKKRTPEQGSPYRDEITLIVTLIVTILLILSNFGLSGVLGEWVNHVMFGIMGVIAYAFPYLLFFLVAFRISNRKNAAVTRKIIYLILILAASAGLAQLIGGGIPAEKWTEYYTISAQECSGGGLVGGLIVALLDYLVGKIGAYLILTGVILICFTLLTGKMILSAMKKRGEEKLVDYRERRRTAREYEEEMPEQLAARGRKRQLYSYEAEGTVSAAEKKEKKSVFGRKKEEKAAGEITEILPKGMQTPPITLDDVRQRKQAQQAKEEDTDVRRPMPPIRIHKASDVEEAAKESAWEGAVPFKPEDADTIPVPEKEAEPAEKEPESAAVPSGYQTEVKPVLREKVEIPKNKRESKADDILDLTAVMSENKPEEAPYVFPPFQLLSKPKGQAKGVSDKELQETAMKLQSTLESFGVRVTVTNVSCGPSVTRYELQPEQGVKVSKITSLSDDIKLNLKATDIRIEAPIPGKAAVGIEVPNAENSTVMLRSLLESSEFRNHPSEITFAVGRDIGGQIVVTDIAKMPHMLIAGATGSGKSVCINTIVMSILYKANPDDVKLIMVDPKVVELSVYNGIPHLLIPVVTDPKKASAALNWAVMEMTDRYKKFAEMGVRDLKGYNKKMEGMPEEERGERTRLPQIVIIVDELADLMMVAPGEVEDAICRLAQMARAAGLHLIIATQRPSVNVITGLIKANIPSRIAFAVSSAIDSRTILDGSGAEKLLGKGDMLFFPSGYPKPVRIQGAFVSDKEVSAVVEFLARQKRQASYNTEINEKIEAGETGGIAASAAPEPEDDRDEYFADAGRFIIEKEKASIGMLQRVYRIGFNRAARIMDQLSEAGVVGPEEGTKPRKILMTRAEFDAMLNGAPVPQEEQGEEETE